MSRKILSVLLAAFLVVGFASFMTKADVTGSFDAKIIIQPIPCQFVGGPVAFRPTPSGTEPKYLPSKCEDTLQKSDFESTLSINWTISGLTLGISTVAGFTGIEHVLTTLKATLGALNITDNFFFATPFGTDEWCFGSIGDGTNPNNFECELAYTVISNNLLFVKKRVDVSISIAGITLRNLAEYADVNFPRDTVFGLGHIYTPNIPPLPCAESMTDGRCPFLPDQSEYPHGYTAANQNFAFGDALTISGQTVSGITVRSITGLCIDPQLYEGFKKISFAGAINPLCAGGTLLTNVALGQTIAADYQTDRLQTPSRVVTRNISSTITVASGPYAGNAITIAPLTTMVGTIPANTLTCTNAGDGTHVNCSKSFTITAAPTNTGPVYVAISTALPAGQLLGPAEYVQVTCQPIGEIWPFAGGTIFRAFPGEIHACGWNAYVKQGQVLYTDIGILNPESLSLTLTTMPKPGLFFDVEKLQLEGVPIGPVTANFYLEFRPNLITGNFPFALESDLAFATPLGNVTAVLKTTDITKEFLTGALLTLSAGGATIASEFNQNLAPLLTTVTLAATLNADSNPASLKVRARICQGTGYSYEDRA
jgi:hypothetical protein